MPPKVIVASEGARGAIIAVAMLVVLGASLGAAYVYTVRPHRGPMILDGATFLPPAGWREVEDEPVLQEFAAAYVYEDPAEPKRRVVIGTALPEDISKLRREWSRVGDVWTKREDKSGMVRFYLDVEQSTSTDTQRFIAMVRTDVELDIVVLMRAPHTGTATAPDSSTDREVFDALCDSVTTAK